MRAKNTPRDLRLRKVYFKLQVDRLTAFRGFKSQIDTEMKQKTRLEDDMHQAVGLRQHLSEKSAISVFLIGSYARCENKPAFG